MTMLTYGVDPESAANAASGGGKVYPAGKGYVLRGFEKEVRPSNKPDGYPSIMLKCEILDSPGGVSNGKKATRWFSLSPKAIPYRLLPFLQAAGIHYQFDGGRLAFDDDQLLGATTRVECRHKPGTTRTQEEWENDEPVQPLAAPAAMGGFPPAAQPQGGAPGFPQAGPPAQPPVQQAVPQYQQPPMQQPVYAPPAQQPQGNWPPAQQPQGQPQGNWPPRGQG